MNDMLYEIDGNMGKTLQVYEDRCVISSKASLTICKLDRIRFGVHIKTVFGLRRN